MKKILLPLIGALVILAGALMPLGSALAAPCTDASPCKPYLKALGADVFAGGWFTHPTACATNSQDPFFSDKQSWYGGIQTYANQSGTNSNGGASSQYGAFALGAIEDGSPKGFYSAGARAPAPVNQLSFANTTSWGGRFEGTTQQSHCIRNYYALKPNGANDLTEGTFPGNGSWQASNIGAPNAWELTSSDVSIPPNSKITIFVDGNVYISHPITYQASTADSVPKFALVVQGNIFIAPSVSRLDGFYITQPHNLDQASATGNPAPADDGVIWTCHPQSNAFEMDLTYPLNCDNKLVINGAVVAKQIHWLRIKGDLTPAVGTSEDGGADSIDNARNSSNVAEVVNYTPEMVIGGSFFTTPAPTTYKIQSLIYLPPVF